MVRAWVTTVVLVGLLATPAHAATPAEKIANQVFTDYTKDGRIDPCDYTPEELQTALDNVDPGERQYASDYPAAIRQAIRFRARGGCDKDAAAAAPSASAAPSTGTGAAAAAPSGSGTPAATVPPVTPAGGTTIADPPAPGTAAPPAGGAPTDTAVERAAAAAPSNDAPAPLVGLGLLAVLIAMTAALLLVIRRLGRGEGRLAPTYHSWREARWRAGGVWADFRDWLSLGR